MNPFLLTPRERLEDWKKLRNHLKTLDEPSQLKAVAQYFAQAPLARYAYNPEDSNDWLSPWEMISAGDWCRNSVAIGMEFTLRLSGWNPGRLRLVYLRDYDLSDMIMVLEVDGNKLLNYEFSTVVNLPTTRRDILYVWQHDGKHHYRQL